MVRQFWGLGALLLLGGCAIDEGPAPTFNAGGSFQGGPFPAGGSGVVSSAGSPGFQPPLPGAVFTAAQQPQPVSGGTLLVLKNQKTAIVADPDRDQVVIVDLESMSIKHTLALEPLSDPGRAAEDAQGHVHLVLRGQGKLLTFDPTSAEVLGTRGVCAYPRGLAVDDTAQLVHVACAEGRLVSLSTNATTAAATRDVMVDRDLRDVVLSPDGLWVSRFRSAEVLRLDKEGAVLARVTLPSSNDGINLRVPSVAWRMVSNGAGGVIVVHQRAFAGEVIPSPGGYGGLGQGGIVEPAVSEVNDTNQAVSNSVGFGAPLPVDVARSAETGDLLVASATIKHPDMPRVLPRTPLVHPAELKLSATPVPNFEFVALDTPANANVPEAALVAVAFAGNVPVMQFREPSSLVFGSRGVALPGDSVADTGNTLFHLETSSGLACASCHPEGQEDGRVWQFQGFGQRRTQSLRGGMLDTAPFHWDGIETDFTALSNDVMSGRMGGPGLTPEHVDALAHYVDRFPAIAAPPTTSTPQIERGKQLFDDETVGCASCHNGARFSNNKTVDVGSKDGPLQVPGLIGLWARAPYLHDGCAKTIAGRFDPSCNTSLHGNLQGLTPDDLAAMTAYLETL